MLTFEEFQTLDEDLQTQVLALDGVYLELIRRVRNLNVELYALFTFYVEVFFNRETEEPLYLKAFNRMQNLDPYLELIDIGGVLGIREEGI
jgi:hypothetical protein